MGAGNSLLGGNLNPNDRTTLITVTYGDRAKHLSKLLERCLGEEGVSQAIVVNNASISDLSSLKAKWGRRAVFLDMNSNTGSACGYGAGIKAALSLDSDYLWLMDDDNAPAKGAMRILRRELASLTDQIGKEYSAVLGLRCSRVKTEGELQYLFPLRSSFLGFHLAQLPKKLMRRLNPSRFDRDISASPIDIDFAPYGGFFAHREAFMRLGIPRRDMVLYADDWEYTMRLTNNRGRIRLVPEAGIEDLEKAWNRETAAKTIFVQSLVSGADFQIYYAFRNHVWLARRNQCDSEFVYSLNKFAFMSMLSVLAVAFGRLKRLGLIRRAIMDGERGRLGVNTSFPLPR